MKKNVLILCLSYSLASCGGGGGSGDDGTPTTTPPANGSAKPTLEWTAPSSRTDGSFLDLSELSGYKIYSGPSSTNLELVAEVDDANATSYDLSSMAPGDYYFGIISYDVNGLRSPISERIVKTIEE